MMKFSELKGSEEGQDVLDEDCDHWQRLCNLILSMGREKFNASLGEIREGCLEDLLDGLQTYDKKSFDHTYGDLFKTTEARIECRKYPSKGDND